MPWSGVFQIIIRKKHWIAKMDVHVVTEGKTDELLVRKLLTDELIHHPQIRVVEAGGRSSAQSLARSILGARSEPVAVVIDADTVDSAQLSGQRDFLESYFGKVAG